MMEWALDNLELQDVKPLICGEQRCGGGHTYGPAIRSYHLLHYVECGGGIFCSPRGKFAVGPGEIFYIRPGEETVYTASADTPWHYRWIGFRCDASLMPEMGDDILNLPTSRQLFHSIIYCDHAQEARELFICGKIYELLALIREMSRTPDPPAQYVQIAKRYIEENYHEEMRVEDIAAMLHIDRSYFGNLFRRHTGKTPKQYIVDLRLNKAAALLLRHNCTVGEVASQVGYKDIFSFSRMFKNRFGVPPSSYGS